MEINFEELLALCKSGRVNLRSDSRLVEKGDIFVALAGDSIDGTAFIPQAVERGASIIVCSQKEACLPYENLKIFISHDPHETLIGLAKARFRTPAANINVLGVTGTNGKTTSAYLLEYLFQSNGHKTGVLGTVSWRWPGHSEPARLTTPDVLEIHSMLQEMEDAGCDEVIMEVSSHALAKKRVDGLSFVGVIFTNLTQDHLDFHKNMESYFMAKARLFYDLPLANKKMAINSDDKWGRHLLEQCPWALAYGLQPFEPGRRQLLGEILEHSSNGLVLKMRFGEDTWIINSRLIGSFNALNLLGVQALALELGFKKEDLGCLENFMGVPGRMERIVNREGLNIFVDYAHTPDALTNAILTLREAGFKRVLVMFGCGGNRDKGKRPLMGEAVAKLADIAILTSDNPRFEDPHSIIEDVLPGLSRVSQLVIEEDRKLATKKALELLTQDDALLIAGKGHEEYQIINGVKHHYSDQEIVREFLNCA